MEGTQVLIARVRRAGMPRPDKIPWSALVFYERKKFQVKIEKRK